MRCQPISPNSFITFKSTVKKDEVEKPKQNGVTERLSKTTEVKPVYNKDRFEYVKKPKECKAQTNGITQSREDIEKKK